MTVTCHPVLNAVTSATFLLTILSPHYRGNAESIDPRYRRSGAKHRLPFVGLPIDEENFRFGHRRLQTNATNSSLTSDECSLCRSFALLDDVVPPYEPSEELPEGLTCRDWEAITAAYPLEYSELSSCQYLISLFGPACCDTPPSYVCEQNVRSQIFSNYDAAVAPLEKGRLEVGNLLEFYHITDLDLKSATAEIFTWLHLNWTDPRLSWDSSNTNTSTAVGEDMCASSITVRASLNADITEIWVPDYDLYNQASGVQNMPEAFATVFPDGTVMWRRNGGIRALCFFSGLQAFPYDTLGCSFLFGGWTRQLNVKWIRGGENGDGFRVGDTARDIQYTEYKLIPEKTETGYYQDSDNILYYNFYFERAQRYYVTKIVIPTIIFTILSFGVFLLDPRVGERLTYGLTVLLVIIAQDIVTSERLPVADERLWINVFSNASFYWVLVALVESIFVMWLYFLRDNEEGIKKNDDEGHQVVSGDAEVGGAGDDSDDRNGSSTAESSMPFHESPPERPKLRGLMSVRQKTGNTFKQVLMATQPKHLPRYRFIKKFDRICFVVVPTSYIIFVIVMLATSPQLWDEDIQDFGDNNNPNL